MAKAKKQPKVEDAPAQAVEQKDAEATSLKKKHASPKNGVKKAKGTFRFHWNSIKFKQIEIQ